MDDVPETRPEKDPEDWERRIEELQERIGRGRSRGDER
jgi:hypothetical protein